MFIRMREEEGAVAVIVALSLLAIIGIAAIVTDGGNLYRERSSAQNAADHAALTAAWAACEPGPGEDYQVAGRRAAAEHGYSAAEVTIEPHPDGILATIDTSINATFGAALGADELDAVASAVATCTIGGDGYAIFADGTCGNSVDLSGSTGRVEGGVHTNENLKVTGSNHSIVGTVTYVGKAPKNAAGNIEYTPRAPLNPVNSDPKVIPGHSVDDYLPGGAYHDADNFYDAGSKSISSSGGNPATRIDPDTWIEDGELKPGIYYSDNDIVLNSSDFDDGIVKGNVTLVSRNGRISVTGPDSRLTAFAGPFNANGDLGMLAITEYEKNPKCTSQGISFSGSSVEWEGILYAPNSRISVTVSDSSTFAGQILGYSVMVSASDSNIINPNDQDAEGFVALMR